MNKFISDVAAGTYTQEGWPKNAYGVSKIGVSALTRILAQYTSLPLQSLSLPDLSLQNKTKQLLTTAFRQEDCNPDRRGVLVTACCPGWCATGWYFVS
jgi:hypothetical protein